MREAATTSSAWRRVPRRGSDGAGFGATATGGRAGFGAGFGATATGGGSEFGATAADCGRSR